MSAWKWGVMSFGLMLALLTGWQIGRQERNASIAQEQAEERIITEASDRVTQSVSKTLGDQYKEQIKFLTDQFGTLEGQLAIQNSDLDQIIFSKIVSGKGPLDVYVVNQPPPVPYVRAPSCKETVYYVPFTNAPPITVTHDRLPKEK